MVQIVPTLLSSLLVPMITLREVLSRGTSLLHLVVINRVQIAGAGP